MRWIATQTVSGVGTLTVTFNNIPQDFQSLRLHVWGRGTFNNGGGGLSVNLGYGAGTPAIRHHLQGDGANASQASYSSSNGSVASLPDVNAASTIYGANIIEIVDYASSNKNKTLNYFGGFDRNGSGNITTGSSFVTLSAPITQIQITTDGNWGDASRIDLYGFATSAARGA
jgi:hypothetical protein